MNKYGSFCILAFPLRGFIRKVSILLGDILLIFILYSFTKLSSTGTVEGEGLVGL